MDSDLAQQAIQAAINGEWKTAERLNKATLDQNPTDLDILLRTAHAATQLGKKQEAARFYGRVIKIDPHNPFALRGLAKIKKMKGASSNQHHLETLFLEEPGKTKTATLVHIAGPQVLAHLDSGEKVTLVPLFIGKRSLQEHFNNFFSSLCVYKIRSQRQNIGIVMFSCHPCQVFAHT